MADVNPAIFAKKPFYRRDPFTTIALTFAVFLISQVIAAVIIGVYPALKNWTEAESTLWLENSVAAQFVYIALAEIIAVLMVLQLVKRAKIIKARVGFVSPRLRDIGYAAVAYGLYFIAYLIIIIVATRIVPSLNTNQEQQVGFDSAYSSLELLMTFASLVIFPPIAEEIIFRGYLFTSLRAKFRLRYAIILTSILFGIAHLQFGSGAPLLWVAAIDTFILSCFLCYLRERSGSLWPPILLHAIKNTVAFFILFGPRFLAY
ncbi:CPBP family intramembrane metalloprotease [Candidatus Saccharibacteria bacterium]|nr:CPBP family intramembrane metalloprotease [Candidatus Saccharibacteria bacterium]